jgi:ubiquinone/menaquinone biosynthesis C-methylase UbiE
MADGPAGLERVRARLRKVAFESLYGPFAWAYDWVSRTFFLGQWRLWQRASIPHLRGKRVLEIGMGTGNLQIDLARAGFEAWGIDLSHQMLRQAGLKARRLSLPPFRACRARAQSLPFPGASFDSLVSTFPSEYIAEDEALVELARVLKPGGRLVIVPGGWLQSKGTKGKAMEGVARAVYGYRSSAEEHAPDDGDKAFEQIAALRKSGWYHWITALGEHMAKAGFSPSARVASNDKGACLIIVADKA